MASDLWTWERCGEKILTLKNRLGFLDQICFLKYCISTDGTVQDTLNSTTVEKPDSLYWILTHYAEAQSTPLTDELVPYNKLPGGYAFFGAFRQLAIAPLINTFGDDKDRFVRSCSCFKGVPRAFGDSAFEISALPLIPLTIILWEKNEEFPPRCSMLYDTSASSYLPTEDLAHVGELLTHRLIQASQKV